MPHSDLIRKYFSANENKDRKAVESLLTDDFVFTSPYDYHIDREAYFKRCWPYRLYRGNACERGAPGAGASGRGNPANSAGTDHCASDHLGPLPTGA